MKTTQEMIEVMQAYEDDKNVQIKALNVGKWMDWNNEIRPTWNWEECDYRIKPEKKQPKYRPYKDVDEMIADYVTRFCAFDYPKHVLPLIWLKEECGANTGALVTDFGYSCIWVGCYTTGVSMEEALKDYLYLDGSPVGKLVE